ncbi:type II toxin-antitoxin system PemK/MazF family toxin [Listeria monocytogenes]|nr:type II toxin-antitoxin system PemK/MazF family toxin [Listeria monocytogenes]
MVTQGDIIKINLNPKQAYEQQGYRPYICLSHHLVSDYANIAIFAPISNTPRSYPLYIPLTDTKTTGQILLDQLVTIDYNARKFNYVETISSSLLIEVLEKVKVIFQMNEK